MLNDQTMQPTAPMDPTQTGIAAPAAGLPDQAKVIPRDKVEVPEQRKKLVQRYLRDVAASKKHWEKAFKRMQEDMDFAEGFQIEGKNAEEADQYVANLVLRHVNERVATLYAKDPRAVVKRTDRMDSQIWDGSAEPLMQAQASLQQAMQTGLPPDPMALELLQEAQAVLARRKMIDGVGRTLQCLFHHFTREGTPPFKVQAKQLVRRAETCGVGYIKLGFQRVMEKNADIVQKLNDTSAQLERAQALAADIADGETEHDAAEVEELKLMIENLQQQVEIVAREGLVFDFPTPTRIIPDKKTKHIRGFIGAGFIAEEFVYTVDEVKELFERDLSHCHTAYKDADAAEGDENVDNCLVYAIYDLKNGLELFVCDGYDDFLKEPAAPDLWMEQGHPYFALTFNNLESRKGPFPPSDVRLLRSMQLEHNRSREALRVHRIANRPGYVAAKGMFDETDLQKFGDHVDHEIMEMKVPQGTDMTKAIMAKPVIPIDENLYQTEHLFVDMQRVTGSQEANFGGTSGSTATESSIAESSRISSVGSNVDDLDDFLTAVARAAGQVLLTEMSGDKVIEIVGPGAIWPEMSRKEIAEEITLEIQAGSSGKPNVAQELANMERGMPFLIQIPGMNPTVLGKRYANLLDMDVDEMIVEGMPSITALNAMASRPPAAPGAPGAQPGTGDPANDPNAQGPQGAANAPKPAMGAPGPQPGYPTGEPSMVRHAVDRATAV